MQVCPCVGLAQGGVLPVSNTVQLRPFNHLIINLHQEKEGEKGIEGGGGFADVFAKGYNCNYLGGLKSPPGFFDAG